jgi:hypothetical protein
MSTELAPRPAGLLPMTLQDTLTLGKVFAESRLFKDTTDAAKAVVKILYGRELGIGPMAAMLGIDVIDGAPTPNAALMASLIQNHPRFDYRVLSWDEHACELAFYQDGEERGRSLFTMADAKRAKLSEKDNWQKYPKAMLLARAMSQGARAYCAAVFAGGVYTAEELTDAPMEATEGAIVDGAFTVEPPPAEITPDQKVAIESLFTQRGLRAPTARGAWFQDHKFPVARVGQLTETDAGEVIAVLRAEILDADAIDAPPTEDSTGQ